MKVMGTTTNHVEVDITPRDVFKLITKIILKRAKLPTYDNSRLYINDKGIIMEEMEVGGGTHSWLEDHEIDTNPTKLKALRLLNEILHPLLTKQIRTANTFC